MRDAPLSPHDLNHRIPNNPGGTGSTAPETAHGHDSPWNGAFLDL
ncbi:MULTISPECIES: hypothetical protein [unclassified Streptomyces]